LGTNRPNMNARNPSSSTTSFKVDYPRQAAEAILRNSEYLKSLISDKIEWQIDISAGYNVVPDNYSIYDPNQNLFLQGILPVFLNCI